MILTLSFSMSTLSRLLAADGLATVKTSTLITWVTVLAFVDVVVKTSDGDTLGRPTIDALRAAADREIDLRIPERT